MGSVWWAPINRNTKNQSEPVSHHHPEVEGRSDPAELFDNWFKKVDDSVIYISVIFYSFMFLIKL